MNSTIEAGQAPVVVHQTVRAAPSPIVSDHNCQQFGFRDKREFHALLKRLGVPSVKLPSGAAFINTADLEAALRAASVHVEAPAANEGDPIKSLINRAVRRRVSGG